MGHSRIAEIGLSGGNRCHYAGLCADLGAVADGHMSGQPHLACQNDPVADFRRAGHPDLGAHNTAHTYVYVVPDLDEVINFCIVANDRAGNFGAVNAGIGLHFYIVAQNHIADLRDFLVASVVKCKPETVRADFSPGLQNNVIFQYALLADNDLRVNVAVLADGYIFANVTLWENNGIVADLRTVLNNGISPDRNICPQFGRPADNSGGVNAGGVFLFLCIGIFH